MDNKIKYVKVNLFNANWNKRYSFSPKIATLSTEQEQETTQHE